MFLKENRVIKLYCGGKNMRKYPIIGGSILAIVLLILGSFTNMVGYQTVQASNQKIISTEVNPKELLFQTIVDMANNKEIQRIVFKAQMNRGIFFHSKIKLLLFRSPVFTMNQLRKMYVIGLFLSKTISKSKIHSMVTQYQINNPGLQKQITAVIEKDATLKEEITQLSALRCDCENESLKLWHFPVVCVILLPLRNLAMFASLLIEKLTGNYFPVFLWIFQGIGNLLGCFWTYPWNEYVVLPWR